MSIELGSIGATVGNIASGIGKAGAGAGPTLAGLGEVMKAPLGNIINEGPAGAGFLGGEILFQAKPSILPAVVEPKIIEGASYWFTDIPGPRVVRPADIIMPLVAPKIAEYTQSQPQTRTENRVSVGPTVAPAQAPAVLPQPAPEGVEEMVIEEKMLDQQEDKTEIKESEDVSESKIKIVEAEHVSNERRKKIRSAVRTAKEKGITVAEALPREYWSDKSPLVGEGTDWTLGLTAQALQINPKEYTSLEEVEETSIASVAENIPVAEGTSGRRATVDEVRKVTKGEKHVLGSKTPAEIVTRRLIKKKVEVAKAGGVQKVLENKVETTSEPTLKDFPQLAEVFQKAA